MGAIVYPDEGLMNLANDIIFPTKYWHLFVNPYIVDKTAVVNSFVEPTVSGYVPQGISYWVSRFVILGHQMSIGTNATFTNNDPVLDVACYGYFVTDATGLKIAWARNFDTIQTLPHGGGILQVETFLGQFSANPPAP